MECVANYEVKTECSVIHDGLVLRIKHPKGRYRARIQNIPRSVYTVPFLLSLHLYFDAPTLDEAQDIADDCFADCLNMLAFTTGSSFRRHRIRQIVDATPSKKSGMRSLRYWSDQIEYDDPQPFLRKGTMRAIERLSEFEMPPAIRRAMRWYRIGISEVVPDDQFVSFWLALEIVAEFQKSSEKVADKCPHCQSPLYCETCKTHPVHKPFARQAIRSLIEVADKDCDDTTIDLLFKTRNSLMHGSTLKEIEESLPQPHEAIVDILGELLLKALIHQFPPEMFDGTLELGAPSTYVHRKLQAIGLIQTIVPADADGDLDLSFKGMKVEVVVPGPPQSALPTIAKVSQEQYQRLRELAFTHGDHQEMCRRICEDTKTKDDQIYVRVLSTDVATINEALKRGEVGMWQDLFREIRGDTKGR